MNLAQIYTLDGKKYQKYSGILRFIVSINIDYNVSILWALERGTLQRNTKQKFWVLEKGYLFIHQIHIMQSENVKLSCWVRKFIIFEYIICVKNFDFKNNISIFFLSDLSLSEQYGASFVESVNTKKCW